LTAAGIAVGSILTACVTIRPPSPTGAPTGPRAHVVAADGTGDVRTVADGLAVAREGDTVLVRPGIYREHVVVARSVTLRGDPPASQVIIEFDASSPAVELSDGQVLPNAILLDGANATVEFLTIRGPDRGVAVYVEGGSPKLDNVTIEMAGDPADPDRLAYRFTSGSTAIVSFSDVGGGILIDRGAAPTIESIGLDGPLIVEGPGSDPVIRGDALGDIRIRDGAAPTLTSSTITGTVEISGTTEPEISHNLIDGGGSNPTGLVIEASAPLVMGNTIQRHLTGIEVGQGAAPVIQANAIEDNLIGIAITAPSRDNADGPVIEGNTFCRNDSNLVAPAGSGLTLAGNTLCRGS
jgi:hypothetical protein